MEPTNWASEHSDALRELFALKLSCSEAAAAINKKFKTCYSRNAVLGRARRMGLMRPEQLQRPPQVMTLPVMPSLMPDLMPSPGRPGEVHSTEPRPPRLNWPVGHEPETADAYHRPVLPENGHSVRRPVHRIGRNRWKR